MALVCNNASLRQRSMLSSLLVARETAVGADQLDLRDVPMEGTPAGAADSGQLKQNGLADQGLQRDCRIGRQGGDAHYEALAQSLLGAYALGQQTGAKWRR
jgi:hypothetical protein